LTETAAETATERPPAATATPPRRDRPWLRRIVKGAVAILALAFVIYVVPLRDRCTPAGCEPGLLSTLRGANVPWLAALFGLYLMGSAAWAARWRALLRLAGVELSFFSAWRVTLEAQAGGILLPGGVAGDALRVTFVKTRAPDADLAKIVASVFADRVVGLVTLATMATAVALATGGREFGGFLHFIAAIPLLGALGWIVVRRSGLARSRFLSRGILARAIKPMLEYASTKEGPRALAHGMLLSLVVSVVQLLVVRGLVGALGTTPASEAWVYVGATMGMIVAALPLAPGAWGTADAAYVFFLGQAGVPASVAASVCLLYRVYWYATGVVGAALALRGTSPSTQKP
jgi:uncharacterized protein (TIRG00374 family)